MRRLLWPTVSGVLYFLSWIGFGIWPLAFVCLLPLLWELRDATPRQALWLGAWMGFVTHLGGYTWIVHLLKVFAFAPLPLAVLGYLAICAAQGFLFGVCAFSLRWLWIRTGFRVAALLPLTLVATEFAYPLLFQSYTGVALMPVLPLVQIADLGGPLLLTALQAVVNGALFDALLAWRQGSPPPRWALGASLISLAASGGYGFYRIVGLETEQKLAPAVRVGIAQPNVGELELHQNPTASVRTLWQQSAELQVRGAELIAWPEVGYNLRAVRLTDDGKSITGGVPDQVIAGVERVTSTEAFNSAFMIDPQGRITGHYDKIKLLAFGEYIPGGEWFPQLYKWSPVASHLTSGTTTAPLSGPRGFKFATFICYEDILPGIVRQTMRDHGGGRAHAMVNLTNDSWYGAGHEQEQHLVLAAVRSIEHRRWLIRATSTGISAFVDATGKVVHRIPRNERGVAVRDVPMLQGTTVYEVLGDWPGWFTLTVAAGLFVRGRARG